MWIQEVEVQVSVRQMQGNIDTTLTPPGTQYGATLSSPEQRKPPGIAGFTTLCKPQQLVTNHS